MHNNNQFTFGICHKESYGLYDMKVVSGYVFLRTYYVQKKLTANHAAAISHKH